MSCPALGLPVIMTRRRIQLVYEKYNIGRSNARPARAPLPARESDLEQPRREPAVLGDDHKGSDPPSRGCRIKREPEPDTARALLRSRRLRRESYHGKHDASACISRPVRSQERAGRGLTGAARFTRARYFSASQSAYVRHTCLFSYRRTRAARGAEDPEGVRIAHQRSRAKLD